VPGPIFSVAGPAGTFRSAATVRTSICLFRFLVLTDSRKSGGRLPAVPSIPRLTQEFPFVVLVVVYAVVGQAAGGEVHRPAVVLPRLEAEVASLVVERVPGYVQRTMGHGVLEQRPPHACPVAVDPHEVRLRRPTTDRLLLCADHNQ